MCHYADMNELIEYLIWVFDHDLSVFGNFNAVIYR